ncbi:Hypothetical protein SMAX5B_018976 [Scophthalmus maximus]|uniref:Uncharacterized protein n=1 Tax=Scophthalmus maximus TaxID=52904 RepID=A0A2U9C7Y0_SCOMX|nr:Hypothetical protein SMAX5B_018976 [Scophthalmus maximus]KAF0040042.1 hypothetical protein F2P81_008277 [Scophthalmus maximus]
MSHCVIIPLRSILHHYDNIVFFNLKLFTEKSWRVAKRCTSFTIDRRFRFNASARDEQDVALKSNAPHMLRSCDRESHQPSRAVTKFPSLKIYTEGTQ